MAAGTIMLWIFPSSFSPGPELNQAICLARVLVILGALVFAIGGYVLLKQSSSAPSPPEQEAQAPTFPPSPDNTPGAKSLVTEPLDGRGFILCLALAAIAALLWQCYDGFLRAAR